jgi:AbrB family looped-hinge helix DNA binding protein
MSKSYTQEEIFQVIPGDEENIMLTIPPEICEELGWKEDDVLIVTAEDGKITLKKK